MHTKAQVASAGHKAHAWICTEKLKVRPGNRQGLPEAGLLGNLHQSLQTELQMNSEL